MLLYTRLTSKVMSVIRDYIRHQSEATLIFISIDFRVRGIWNKSKIKFSKIILDSLTIGHVSDNRNDPRFKWTLFME